MHPEPQDETSAVVLIVPANTDSLVAARAVAGAVGAQAGLPVDRLEDFRLAVHEAVALGVEGAPGSSLRLAFGVDPTRREVAVTLTSDAPDQTMDDTSFGWLMLLELCSDVQRSEDGTLELRIAAGGIVGGVVGGAG